jgi:hypothetical protein
MSAAGGGAGSAIGSIIQGLGEVGSAYLTASFARKERERSQNFLRKFTVQKPGLMVEGLKRAGLNPILAADGGFSGGVSGPGFSAPNIQPSGAAGMAAQRIADFQLTKAQARKTNADAALSEIAKSPAMDSADMTAWQRHIMAATVREQIAAGSAHPEQWGGMSTAAAADKALKDANALSARWGAKLQEAAFPKAQVTGSTGAGFLDLLNKGMGTAAQAAGAFSR